MCEGGVLQTEEFPPMGRRCFSDPKNGPFSFCHLFCGTKHMEPSVFHINFTLQIRCFAGFMCALGAGLDRV